MLETINKHPLALKWQYEQLLNRLTWKERLKLRNKDFSIIGNNCIAGTIYSKFGLPYKSPTIWSFMFADDYLRFLGRLEWYLKQPLEFREESKHVCKLEDKSQCQLRRWASKVPVGVLGGDVEVFFKHYGSRDYALETWNRRLKRINYQNVFVVLATDYFTNAEFGEEQFKEFDKLPFKHKLIVSTDSKKQRALYDCNYAVFVEKRKVATGNFSKWLLGEPYPYAFEKQVDLAAWLNGEQSFLKRNPEYAT